VHWSSKAADVAAVAVLLAVAITHLAFILRDQRLPRDMGQYYLSLPGLYAALAHPWDQAGDLLAALVDTGGWYQLGLASWLRIVGRGPMIFRLVDLFWVASVVGLSWRLGRRLSDPVGGMVAVSLVGCCTVVVETGRTGWIHTPETALLLALPLAWLASGHLASRRAVAVLALAGMLAAALRPSGVVWVGSMLPLVMLSLWRRRRLALLPALALLLCWSLGAAVHAQGIEGYLVAKAAAHDRYVAQVPDILVQLRSNLGGLPLVLALLGLVAALGRRPRAVPSLMTLWLALGLGMAAVFGAGMDNFPLFFVALSVLAGIGFSRWLGMLAWLPVVAYAWSCLPNWMPALSPTDPRAQSLAQLGVDLRAGPLDYSLPYQGLGLREQIALIEATCPDHGQECHLVVDQGLFVPFAEDPGQLETFIAGLDHVQIWETRMPSKALQHTEPDALVHFDCGAADQPWRERFAGSLQNLFDLIETHKLLPAWSSDWPPDCKLMWLTPGGSIAASHLLPEALSPVGVFDASQPPSSNRDDAPRP